MSSGKLASNVSKPNNHQPTPQTMTSGKTDQSKHTSLEQKKVGKVEVVPPPSYSSTSSSRSSSSQYYVTEEQGEGEEDEKRDFLESLYDTDNESEVEEDPQYLQRLTLPPIVDFFEEFENIPEIDNISEDVSVTVPATTPKQLSDQDIGIGKDVGHFVNPLTGLSSQSTSEAEIPKSATVAASIETLSKEYSGDITEASETDLDLISPEDKYEDDADDLNKVIDSEDLFENFLEMEAKMEIDLNDNIDWEAVVKQQEAKELYQYTVDFVNDLIRQVVDTASYISPDILLRKHLDKRKLMLEIQKKTQEFEVEHRSGLFLHDKIVEFFRRKKAFRPIRPDSAKTLELEMNKYSYAVERLDQIMAKETNVAAWTLKTKQELESELNEAKDKTQAEIQQFENMVKKNLMRDNRPKCNALIEKLLSEMSKCRQEVTAVRCEMLTKQHTEAALMEKLTKLEDLGNGLDMTNFVSLQTETQALGKKIEERNVELNKLHIRVRSDIHQMAHYRERQKMLRSSVVVQRMALEELMDEKKMHRERIYQLKMQRNRIRLQINDLSFKGGLIAKPALMLDYDQTCEMVKERRAIVCCLRENVHELESKIETLTKRCHSTRLSFI